MSFQKLLKQYDNFYLPPNQEILVNDENIVRKRYVEVLNVTVEEVIDASTRFSFTINDPDSKWLDSELFEPGNIVEIKMGYADKLSQLIVGEIISIRPSFPQDGSPQVEISGYDLSYLFTRVTRYRSWEDKRDSEVVQNIVNEVQHKLAKAHASTTIESTQIVHKKIIQDRKTDYELIKELAKRNSFEFVVNGRNLFFRKPVKKTNPLTLEYKKTLLSFAPEINTSNQVSEVVVKGWNPVIKQEIVGKSQSPSSKAGKSGGEIVENLYGRVERRITDQPIFTQPEANALADSIYSEISENLIRGNAESIGLPEIRVGESIILKGIGKKFSKEYIIERTTHSISTSGYSTSFSVRRGSI